jgi:hypothetical protein
LGSTRYDDAAWKSLRVRRPLVLDYPLLAITININNITEKIISLFYSEDKKESMERVG